MKHHEPDWLTIVREKVETLRYGVVQIVIHDSQVTLIERTEKTRISHRPDTLEENNPTSPPHRTSGSRS